MKNKFSIAMSLAVVLAMLLTSFALAENVKTDVVASGNGTITAGGSTTINYWIQDTGSDGCQASDGSPVTLTISAPGSVTVDTDAATLGNQNTLTFAACNTSNEGSPNNTKAVVFSSSTAGSYSIGISSVIDIADGAAEYNTSPASFTLTVNAAPPPSNTAPSV